MTRRRTDSALSRAALITGGAGFIGSHLADRLISRGETVCVVDNLSTGSRDNIAHLESHPRFTFVEASVRDIRAIDELAHGCDRIYHLAAVVGVHKVLDDPLHVVEENIFGTRATLEAGRRAGASVFVASTSEIYGKNANVPFHEDSDRVLGGPHMNRWSYAASKAVDEILALGYAAQHHVPVVIGRFFNTVGQRQTGEYGMVVPHFIEQALAGEPLSVYGTGEQARAFCDVRDVVRAVVMLMDSPAAAGRSYNIGSRREISIEELARLVLQLLAPERAQRDDAIRHVSYVEAYAGSYEEFPRRVPDISRLQEQIGWTPDHDLTETIEWIAEGLRTETAG